MKFGIAMAAMTPMIPTTSISSISVKPCCPVILRIGMLLRAEAGRCGVEGRSRGPPLRGPRDLELALTERGVAGADDLLGQLGASSQHRSKFISARNVRRPQSGFL